ncbi:efflux RND transporter permease subunit [Alteromonas sp. a30]|uniref:efflux RND transporter permease subunit n=1 Tax=Alteromonas sp. a30 TaxID=2730917 RepID=UPI00227FA7B0|nr:multidrug efflux RND transporter permease subunit [Alteromonas sp. a30]MCY7295623.1 efflux RND transporter permease subunit [Alteromonas sp. a30]
MNFTHFFVDRPRLATVISLMIVIFGLLGIAGLPVAQYPNIVPPQIQVHASYPGASSEIIADTVAAPLEQEINGVESMLYVSSQSTNDGQLTISITFATGTDLDTAQVLVQNRVSAALPRLPEPVRRLGVTTVKNSPDMLMVINLFSPDNSADQTEIGNYAVLNLVDKLSRLDGVGNVQVFGGSEYSMRIWLDPGKMSEYGLTPEDVIRVVQAENLQVSSGTLNQPPMPSQNAFEMIVQTHGRLKTVEEFENIIVRNGERTALLLLKDIAKVELGAQNYNSRGYLDSNPSVVMPITMRPGANALSTAEGVKALMKELSQHFPAGIDSTIVYNPTEYIEASMKEVYLTLLQTIALVVVVIVAFLQSWRTAIIPVVAIPVSLIGTFALMYTFGFSLNMLSLFGLVLAIGIVVDDAIVVVENVERKLSEGKNNIEAAKETMTEVGGALIATSLVLVAVFLPSLLMEGISGEFYRQFGVTIASATMLSTVVSLTLSPAMAALFMRNVELKENSKRQRLGNGFNNIIERFSGAYAGFIRRVLRIGGVMLLVYVGLMSFTGWQMVKIPTGFIPEQDQGYAIIAVQLPSGASLQRTDDVMQEIIPKLLSIDGVKNTVSFTGFSGATFTSASNAGAIFAVFEPFEKRRSGNEIIQDIRAKIGVNDKAFVVTIPPPAVNGIGNGGGFKMMIQDVAGHGTPALEAAAWRVVMAANQAPETTSVFTFFETSTPRIYLNIDREKARQLNVPLQNVFDALESYIGSSYVNDFNYKGRTFRVTVQSESPYREEQDDLLKLRVRSNDGAMVPIGTIATVEHTSGPARLPRFNLYPAAAVTGNATYGYSSGEALARMEQIAQEVLPPGFTYEWTELAYQEKNTGNSAIVVFLLAVVFVFLLLTAQYESWSLPMSIILIVPMCLLSAAFGLLIMHMDNNILTQVGLVVLVGLAAKNAILIVEFAKQNEEHGETTERAAEEAGRLRLRPILMTAFSFIFGVLPLLFATGPGAEMRQAIGLTMFSGMLGVTLFGLIFTPLFYVYCRKASLWRKPKSL